jgi:hypothetical protein
MTLSTGSPQSPHAKFVLALAEVTRPIVGPNAQTWLAKHFERWAPCLGLDRGVHERQPTRAEMKERMNAINHAATVLAKSLNATDTSEFLEGAGSVKIENSGGIENALRLIAEHAVIAAAFLSTEKGETRAGRGKALPPCSARPPISKPARI